MSFASHYRTLSPTRGRHHASGPRASTGMVQAGSYDSYEAPGRYDFDDYYPSDTGYPNTYKYRPAPRSRIDAQPISSQKYRDYGHSTKKRTEYSIQSPSRSRNRSHTASAADLYETPVRLAVPSSHLRPVVNSSRRSPSPLPSDSNMHLSPHGSRHRRVYSTDYASDTGRLEPHDTVKRHSSHRIPHRVQPPINRRRYPPLEGLKKGDDIDSYDAYSYTTPREQFDRDYPVKPRTSTGRTSSSRPLSMNVMEDHPSWLGRRDPRETRPHGPPPTSRGLNKLGRGEEWAYGSPRATDDHLDTARSRGGGYDQALVPVRREESDDGYDLESDDRRRRRHRRHHYEGDRHTRDERSPRPPHENERSLPLGTAALGSGYSDLSDYDHRPTRRHSRRPRDSGYGYDAGQASPREPVDSSPPGSDKNKQLQYLEPPENRPRRNRSRVHSRHRHGSDNDRFTDDEDLQQYRREPAGGSSRRHSSTDSSSDDGRSPRRYPRDRSRRRSSRRMLEDSHAIESRRSPSNGRRDEVRSPVAVDPPMTKEPELAPKGILKPPRPSFPEEPNPIREGVAPLKDAHKKGIPPGARWTKIDRRLVNPEALEAGNERFEERSDYVIVLRVLSKEEIQAYAMKTQEIRGQYLSAQDWDGLVLHSLKLTDNASDTRHKEHVQDRRRRIDDNQRHGRHGEESSSDVEDECEEPRAELEAPPAPEQQERLALPMRPRDSGHSVHESEGVRTSPPAAPM
ncbi:hypothetical protein N7492_000396 [Penicillium capsulatum]|uniref:DUF8035 domain-containing protein n=1 Tax=Penicillium capsulatum TaxID=69766 RepID=A0A9W9IQC0_9EURO|nr:hypothetical protein N7492_000396 [Penicillium capsulatum]KAJ6130542.1 hypothetical protein N7512_003322 [Penicillium capsulatum]